MPLTGQVFTHVLSNHGAELSTNTGDMSGWVSDVASMVIIVNSGAGGFSAPWEGAQYFAGAFNGSYNDARQITYPTSDGVAATDIDAMRVVYTYRGRFKGEPTNNDFSIPKVNFYTDTGSFIGSLIGEHCSNVNSWTEFVLEAILPPNTRQVDVVMNSERNTGTGNNGYFDANSAYSSRVYSSSYVFSGVPTTVFNNPGAEAGSLDQWVVISGAPSATQSIVSFTPRDGNWSFRPSSANFNNFHQVIDIQSLAINTACWQSGLMDLCLAYAWRTNNNLDDIGRVQLRILDASSNELTATHSAMMRNWPGGRSTNPRSEWSYCIERLNIPNNARLIQIICKNQKATGASNNYGWDSMSLWTVTGSSEIVGGIQSRRAFPSGIYSGRDFPTTRLREFPHD